MQTIIYDIETGPLPSDELAAIMPPFDPAEVKYGNIKDPAKIAEKLASSEANYSRDFTEKAALDALTGRVLAIGLLYLETGETEIVSHDDEATLIRMFWFACVCDRGGFNQMVGFDSNRFDLPYLIRRGWKLKIAPPLGIRRGHYFCDAMVDLREIWQLGDRMAKGSLDTVSKMLGVGAKNGSGADFARLWATDRDQAIAYLKNDIELTAKVAKALGIAGM